MLFRVNGKYAFKSQMLDCSCAKVILQFLFKLMIDSHAILYHQRKREILVILNRFCLKHLTCLKRQMQIRDWHGMYVWRAPAIIRGGI